MTHYSARAQWNTANARLANKPFDDLFATVPPAPSDEPLSVLAPELAPIVERIKSLDPDYPAELQAQLRARLVEQNKQFTATDGRGQQITSDTKEKNGNTDERTHIS